jgi:hypothetical protein
MNEQLKQVLDDLVSRRMENTGESKEEAAKHVATYLKKRVKPETFLLPAGEYFVGDTSYILGDDYDHVIQQFLAGDMECGTYTTSSGRKVFISRTYYGDGWYYDQDGDGYPVDAGNIGAVPVDAIEVDDPDEFNLVSRCQWDSSFECSYKDGLIDIGGIEIETNDLDDDDDDS